METRNCPSLQRLHELAEYADIRGYQYMSKGDLFATLRDNYDYERLIRYTERRSKTSKKAASTSEQAYSDRNSSASSSSSSNSSSSTTTSSHARSTRSSIRHQQAHEQKHSNKRKAPSPNVSSSSSSTVTGTATAAAVGTSTIATATTTAVGTSNGNKKKTKSGNERILNKIDPIMFTAIKKKMSWIFKRPNGSEVVFNLDTLIDFMLASGDFTDPETRIPFADSQLDEIDKFATKLGLIKKSVLDAKNNPQSYIESKFRRDGLQGLERCAGEVVTDILNIIETTDPDDAQMRLLLNELPLFSDYFRQLCEVDKEYASQCMEHYLSFLEGPPNRPNEDHYGLLETVMNFLAMCQAQFTQRS